VRYLHILTLIFYSSKALARSFLCATISYEIWRSFKAREKQFSEFVSPFLDLPPSKTPHIPLPPYSLRGKYNPSEVCYANPSSLFKGAIGVLQQGSRFKKIDSKREQFSYQTELFSHFLFFSLNLNC